ncbi:leucine--tRNA ligase [Flavobacterium antarcticum]|uniref:leucine--tRNA ligase n=1 Tax=Flavobacterium antarcticum TaxID=271155 RepID=UPI0003B35296|nr:class I tRNA ligase family protein [Flavobacterium antarcticum]
MKYNPSEIEAKWQKYWSENGTFQAENNSDLPKYYVLDMFPYPSGAGLHVGHPLGYIASDIYARFKRHKGFNVLHPQGYDSFGLPAEQYAIQTGQHPDKTTKENIARYRQQLDRIGFSFDWSREVRTSNPEYYKWTQWIFIQLFESWFDADANEARDIKTLIMEFEANGNQKVNAVCDDNIISFSAEDWNNFSNEDQQRILLQYRMTYLAETEVNWCPGLGTVLANDEIINGVSERGGHPVLRKKMTQWSMRISAYAERLLQGLKDIDWTASLKESQTNWIGKSVGALVTFKVKDSELEKDNVDYVLSGDETNDYRIEVFTTRPDTIFGVTFMTLAPEHDLVSKITTPEQKQAIEAYVEATAKRSERERMADVKTISGVFTGAYAEHPFTKEPVPVWIGDYVLAGYGTGAVMAVPCGDERDYAFANFFKGNEGMPEIKNIFDQDISENAFGAKDGFKLIDSDFLNGMGYKEASAKAIEALEELEQGKGKTNYRLRDAVFSRQRYWGEPFPVYYVNGLPQMIDTKHLPIRLPEVEKYLPTEDGQPPLGNAPEWAWDVVKCAVVNTDLIDHETVFPLELNTMPGWAGSSWYWLRYMDAGNENEFVSAEAQNYWQNVDLYIGGSEHATGHLLYSRFWNKFLKDRGYVNQEEPFKKLINQGMILGMSAFVYKFSNQLAGSDDFDFSKLPNIFISKGFYAKLQADDEVATRVFSEILNSEKLKSYPSDNDKFNFTDLKSFNQIHADVNLVNSSDELDIDAFKNHPLNQHYTNALFIGESGEVFYEDNDKFIVSREVEKMSKSKYNVVTPDDICEEYGADTLRLYEMFLGPLEQAKPWNTGGITGVFGFLRKLWRLYFDESGLIVTSNPASAEALKTLHKTIKKVNDDIEDFSFNTSVSQFMIAVNELTAMKCHERSILEPLAILISPYAPHIAEELWEKLGHQMSISKASFPIFNPQYLVESNKEYPVSFNGKMRFTLNLPLDLTKEQIQEIVMNDERTIKQLEGRTPNKVIIVPGKIINLVG